MQLNTDPPQPPLNLAALLYETGDASGSLLGTLAAKLQAQGYKVGGVLQRRGGCGPEALLEAIDLMTGQCINLCQTLGSGATSCRLDPGGLAEAAMCLRRATDSGADLIIVDKFGKLEAQGRGMAAELAHAVLSGIPVLAAVPRKNYPAWQEFTGGYGTVLLCREDVAGDWWEGMTRWGRLYRPESQPA
jgi:molybdate transport system ATP-binding protein